MFFKTMPRLFFVLFFSFFLSMSEANADHHSAPGLGNSLDHLSQPSMTNNIPVKKLTVKAYQFGFSPSKIIVHQGDLVQIKLTSNDVPHGFYIKAYHINMPAKKGEYKQFEFVANKKGVFPIICSIYCGHGHRDMKGTLVVK